MAERLQSVEQTWVDDAGKTRKVVSTFDETGAKVEEAGKAEAIPAGDLPADFPGRDIFRRAGYGTVEAIRQFRRRGPFTRIEGIDSVTSQAAEVWLAMTPEDDAKAAEATSADAQATATNTKVSEGGGGSEAAGPAPPAKDTRRGAKADGSVGPDSTLGDASVESGGAPAKAGHGTEGLIVGDPNNPAGTHVTTSLSVAPGATKTQATPEGGEGDEGSQEASAPKGKLPAEFPGLKALDEAGIHTYKQLSKYEDDYTKIPGIGDATAKKMEEALNTPAPSEE